MRFSWDEAKNRINIAKHGLDFTIGEYVFDDPFRMTDQDREVDGEPRWQTIGIAEGVHLLLVAHLIYEDEEETIHLISVRKATRHERRKYEQGS